MTRKLGSKAPMRGGRSVGPKDAPAPKIPPQKINKGHQAPKKQPKHPELHTQQLNPISKKFGQPQYKDEKVKGSNLKAIVMSLKSS